MRFSGSQASAPGPAAAQAHPPRRPWPSSPRLELAALRAGAALPEVQPGALPRLQAADLQLDHQLSAAPPSWGAPGALPALRSLSLRLMFAAPLPAEWAAGFRSLRTLLLVQAEPGAAMGGPQAAPPLPPAEAAAAARLPRLRVPPEWGAGGAFPRLRHLRVEAGWERPAVPTTRVEDLLPPDGLATLEEL